MKKNKKGVIMFMPHINGGGVEKNLFLISNYFSKKIDNIKICSISKKSSKYFNKRIDFITPNYSIPDKLNIRIKYILCLFILFKFLLNNKNYIVFSFQANVYCIIICKLLNIKVIVRSNTSPVGWKHNNLKKFIYNRLVFLADEVIVNSFDFKKQMKKRFNLNTQCILNPLNKNEILKKSKIGPKDKFFKNQNDKLKILNVARFTEQKDQMTILKAAKILKNKLNFKLLIIGKGEKKGKLLDFISKNKLNKYIKIRNFMENPFAIINQTNIFVLSSKYEGLPNVLLEASTLKKFIISTNCPTGPKEILANGKGGLLFKIGDYNDLVKKILFYKNNKKKMNKKINYNYKSLTKYNLENNLNKYFLLIKKYIY